MKRILAASLLMLLGLGRHAHDPKLNPFAYGQTCVPPPGTNSVNGTNSYYTAPPAQPGVTPSTGTGFRQAPMSNRWSSLESSGTDPLAASPVGTGVATATASVIEAKDVDVALAKSSVSPAVSPAAWLTANPAAGQTVPATAPVTNPTSRTSGMVLNDLTKLAEPQPFAPTGRVMEISQLPNPPAGVTSPTTTPAIITASATQSNNTATTLDGWRTR